MDIWDFVMLISILLCMFENPHNEKLKKIKRILKDPLGSRDGKLFKWKFPSDADRRVSLEKVQDYNC